MKHVKGLFKAEGINNSAEPGNSMHARFHVSVKSKRHQADMINNTICYAEIRDLVNLKWYKIGKSD